MRKIVFVAFLSIVAFMAKAQQSQEVQQNNGFQASPVSVSNYYDIENGKYFRVHVVEKGHTLYSIAKAYKCAVSDIIETLSDNTLSIGEAVRIPIFSQKDINSLVRYNIKDTLVKQQQITQATVKTQDANQQNTNSTTINEAISNNSKDNKKQPKEQSSKKPSKNADSTTLPTVTNDTSPQADINPAIKTQNAEYIPPQPKEEINISLMLPLYTNDINFPKKQYYFLTMLQGVLVALAENDISQTSPEQQADGQKSPKINLNVFDLTEDEASWNKAKNDKRFLSSDIILCAAYRNIFPRLDSFSKTKHIPLVHLHSERDSMSSGNPYFMQLLPSLSTQIKILADTFVTHYSNSNFLIFLDDTNTTERFQAAQYLFKILEKAKNENRIQSSNLHLYNSNKSGGYQKAVSLLDKKKHNIICGFTRQEILLANMFVPLLKNNPSKESGMLINDYNISLFGPATWAYFTKIDPELFNKTYFTYFNTFTTQTEPVSSKVFEKKFYNEYGTLPDGMAYKGYVFAKWLFEAVQLYNTDFMSHMNEQNDYSVLGVKFNFQKSIFTSGYENHSIELVKFFE